MSSNPVECSFEPGDARLPFEDAEPVRSEIAALSAAGFARLGVKRERVMRSTPSFETSYASNARRCFVSWFMGSQGYPLVYAYTVFQDGALVLTSRGGNWAQLRAPSAVRVVLPVGTLDQLLERHAAEVKSMEDKGHAVREGWDREARLEATRIYYANRDVVPLGPWDGRVHRVSLAANVAMMLLFAVQLLTLSSARVTNLVAAAACTVTVGHLGFLALSARGQKAAFPWREALGTLLLCGIVVANAMR